MSVRNQILCMWAIKVQLLFYFHRPIIYLNLEVIKQSAEKTLWPLLYTYFCKFWHITHHCVSCVLLRRGLIIMIVAHMTSGVELRCDDRPHKWCSKHTQTDRQTTLLTWYKDVSPPDVDGSVAFDRFRQHASHSYNAKNGCHGNVPKQCWTLI